MPLSLLYILQSILHQNNGPSCAVACLLLLSANEFENRQREHCTDSHLDFTSVCATGVLFLRVLRLWIWSEYTPDRKRYSVGFWLRWPPPLSPGRWSYTVSSSDGVPPPLLCNIRMPSFLMFNAAQLSRSWWVPQLGQSHSLIWVATQRRDQATWQCLWTGEKNIFTSWPSCCFNL